MMALVGVLQGLADVDGHAEGVPPVEHAGHADALDDLRQVLALDVLHRDPAVGPGLAGPVQ